MIPRAVLLLLGLLLVPAGLLVGAVHTHLAATRWAQAQTQRLIVGHRQKALAIPALEAELAALTRAQTTNPGYLEAATPAAATAALYGAVKSALAPHGVAVRSLQALPGAREGDLERLGVRVEATLAGQRLGEALRALEGATPRLFIDGLELRVLETRKGEDQDVQLSLRLEISAYRRAGST